MGGAVRRGARCYAADGVVQKLQAPWLLQSRAADASRSRGQPGNQERTNGRPLSIAEKNLPCVGAPGPAKSLENQRTLLIGEGVLPYTFFLIHVWLTTFLTTRTSGARRPNQL